MASVLGTSSNLRSLLSLSTKIDDSLPNDALRCIANTLLLNESARATFVGPEVNGGHVCIDLLQVRPFSLDPLAVLYLSIEIFYRTRISCFQDSLSLYRICYFRWTVHQVVGRARATRCAWFWDCGRHNRDQAGRPRRIDEGGECHCQGRHH